MMSNKYTNQEKGVNDYFVTLTLIPKIGEYEKIAYHLVRAENDVQAYKAAIEAESHGDLEWIDDSSAWDMGEMIYEVYDARVLSANEVQVLKNVGIF